MKTPKKKYLIDTNVILRFLLNDHETFSPMAINFMTHVERNLKKTEIIAPVIAECVYVMEKFYKIPRAEIADKLCGIMTFSGITNPDKNELIIALIAYENSTIDIVDCMLAAFSDDDNVIISLDKDFKKLDCTYERL